MVSNKQLSYTKNSIDISLSKLKEKISQTELNERQESARHFMKARIYEANKEARDLKRSVHQVCFEYGFISAMVWIKGMIDKIEDALALINEVKNNTSN